MPLRRQRLDKMKPNRKQIEALLRNKIASQYTGTINELKERVNTLLSDNRNARIKAHLLEQENIELKDKLRQYEDWIERLCDFVNMKEDDRKAYVNNIRAQKLLNQAVEKIDLYTQIFERIFH